MCGEGKRVMSSFKMNVMTILPRIFNKQSKYFAYMLELFNVLHGRLGHVMYDTIPRGIHFE